MSKKEVDLNNPHLAANWCVYNSTTKEAFERAKTFKTESDQVKFITTYLQMTKVLAIAT